MNDYLDAEATNTQDPADLFSGPCSAALGLINLQVTCRLLPTFVYNSQIS